MEAVEDYLRLLEVEPVTVEVAAEYARIRTRLEMSGRPMSAKDLWIAAHALCLDRTLVTDARAFERVPDLQIDNWMR